MYCEIPISTSVFAYSILNLIWYSSLICSFFTQFISFVIPHERTIGRKYLYTKNLGPVSSNLSHLLIFDYNRPSDWKFDFITRCTCCICIPRFVKYPEFRKNRNLHICEYLYRNVLFVTTYNKHNYGLWLLSTFFLKNENDEKFIMELKKL